MGDSLQRIYGFIGAIPNLLDLAQNQFSMEKIFLDKNYRFIDNSNMLWLDYNIRKNAINPLNPAIMNNAIIDLYYAQNQENEIEWIVQYLSNHIDKTAILVQMRNPNINMLMNELDKRGIPYFYALFSDEDERYINYHRTLMRIFVKSLEDSKSGRINKVLFNQVFRKITLEYKDNTDKLIDALLKLTKVFFNKVVTDYRFLENEEKIAYIKDTIEGRALKQNMDAIESNLFISTVHGAKGLEWDQVIMPDMEPYVFPNYGGLCGNCNYYMGRQQDRYYCKINISNHDINEFLEELSVFYVAVTRARKRLVFSASACRYTNEGQIKESKLSCLLYLPGISINQLQ